MEQPEFSFCECILRIRSSDAMTFEDAFSELSPIADRFVLELCSELDTACDSYTRGKLIELLGFTHSNQVLPVLQRELSNDDITVRNWVALALEEINSTESLRILNDYKTNFPSDFA